MAGGELTGSLSREVAASLESAAVLLLGSIDRGDGWLPQYTDLMQRMTSAVRKMLDGASFAVYGSAKSGYGLSGCDLDVSLVAPWMEPADQHLPEIKGALRRLSGMFRNIGLHSKAVILHAHVPIVKLEGSFRQVIRAPSTNCITLIAWCSSAEWCVQ